MKELYRSIWPIFLFLFNFLNEFRNLGPLFLILVAVGFGVEKWLELGKRGLTSMTEGRAERNHDNGKENERKEE